MMFATWRDVEAGRQLAAHVEQPPQLSGKALAAGQQASGLEGRRGLVGEDQQEPLVVVVELVRGPSFESVITPTTWAVVAHRDDEHRLVDVVGPRRCSRRADRRSRR